MGNATLPSTLELGNLASRIEVRDGAGRVRAAT
jgi:hypothetical protein